MEELKYEKELSDAKADKCIALEETVQELRQTNRSLEDKIARLCEAPFISDAYGQQESRLRYEELVREREELKAKVDHLQEAVRTQYSALTSLKQHAAQLREEKDASDRRAEEAGANLKELQSGTSMLQDKLKMYSGDDGVDVESLERALTLIKRRGEAMDKLPFLEDPEIEQLVTVPALRRKLEDVQIMNLRLSEEAQRLENMLKLQSSINKDLHNELETLVRARDKDKRDLQQKAENFEEIALKRLDKIHALEAQVRQFVYGLSKNSGKVGKGFPMIVTPEKENDDAIEEETDNALLAELLNERGGDLRPDENILEIWIKGASIRDGIMTPGSSSFMVVDFFDYESQTTSLLSGQKPQWDFATTYKIIVDDFLIRYLATDSVSLELNLVSYLHYFFDEKLLTLCYFMTGITRRLYNAWQMHLPSFWFTEV